jgi:hypothetical protein
MSVPDPRIQALAQWLMDRNQGILYHFDLICSAPHCKNPAAYLYADPYQTRIDQIKFVCARCAKEMEDLVNDRAIAHRNFVERKSLYQ